MQPQVLGVEPHDANSQEVLGIANKVAPETSFVGPNPRAPSGEELVKSRFRDIDIPTALLQRAITSASNNKAAAEHSELMNFLHAQNDRYNNQARILIDSALADSISKKLDHRDSTEVRVKLDQRDSTEVRVYDLDDLRAGNIRSKINPPPEDGHFLFLTGKQ
jgi:hypothetical protein